MDYLIQLGDDLREEFFPLVLGVAIAEIAGLPSALSPFVFQIKILLPQFG